MSFHCFTIPALHPGAAQDELNQFVATQRVLAVRREFVADGAASFWALCVEVAHGPGPLPSHLTASGSTLARSTGTPASASRSTVDYKHVLNEADFTRFAALRELRKQRAQAEGVPVFAVFTNEQLALIAQRQPSSLAALGEIEGIGPARIEKYGADVLACLAQLFAAPLG